MCLQPTSLVYQDPFWKPLGVFCKTIVKLGTGLSGCDHEPPYTRPLALHILRHQKWGGRWAVRYLLASDASLIFFCTIIRLKTRHLYWVKSIPKQGWRVSQCGLTRPQKHKKILIKLQHHLKVPEPCIFSVVNVTVKWDRLRGRFLLCALEIILASRRTSDVMLASDTAVLTHWRMALMYIGHKPLFTFIMWKFCFSLLE